MLHVFGITVVLQAFSVSPDDTERFGLNLTVDQQHGLQPPQNSHRGANDLIRASGCAHGSVFQGDMHPAATAEKAYRPTHALFARQSVFRKKEGKAELFRFVERQVLVEHMCATKLTRHKAETRPERYRFSYCGIQHVQLPGNGLLRITTSHVRFLVFCQMLSALPI